VARSACFQLVFAADIREYADIAEALWTAVQPRLVDNYSDANASIVIAYNEEYIVPNEYVEFYVFSVNHEIRVSYTKDAMLTSRRVPGRAFPDKKN